MKKMKMWVMMFSVFAFLLIGAGGAFADVLNFEDLGSVSFTNPYHGFTFSNAGAYNKSVADDGTYRWDGTNGSYSIYTTPEFAPISMSSPAQFALDSFYVTTDPDPALNNATIHYRGWYSATEYVYAHFDPAANSTQYFVNFAPIHDTTEWDNIYKLDVWATAPTGFGYDITIHVCLDDITYNSGSATVPEPSGLLLLASGIIGLVGLRRRFF